MPLRKTGDARVFSCGFKRSCQREAAPAPQRLALCRQPEHIKNRSEFERAKPRFALFPLGPIAMNRGAKPAYSSALLCPRGFAARRTRSRLDASRPDRLQTDFQNNAGKTNINEATYSIDGRNHSVPCLSRVINKIMKRTTKSKGVFVERELFLYASNFVFRMRVLQNTLLVTSAAKPNIHGITCRMTALRNTDARASLGSQVIGMNMLKI